MLARNLVEVSGFKFLVSSFWLQVTVIAHFENEFITFCYYIQLSMQGFISKSLLELQLT